MTEQSRLVADAIHQLVDALQQIAPVSGFPNSSSGSGLPPTPGGRHPVGPFTTSSSTQTGGDRWLPSSTERCEAADPVHYPHP